AQVVIIRTADQAIVALIPEQCVAAVTADEQVIAAEAVETVVPVPPVQDVRRIVPTYLVPAACSDRVFDQGPGIAVILQGIGNMAPCYGRVGQLGIEQGRPCTRAQVDLDALRGCT